MTSSNRSPDVAAARPSLDEESGRTLEILCATSLPGMALVDWLLLYARVLWVWERVQRSRADRVDAG